MKQRIVAYGCATSAGSHAGGPSLSLRMTGGRSAGEEPRAPRFIRYQAGDESIAALVVSRDTFVPSLNIV